MQSDVESVYFPARNSRDGCTRTERLIFRSMVQTHTSVMERRGEAKRVRRSAERLMTNPELTLRDGRSWKTQIATGPFEVYQSPSEQPSTAK